MPKIEVTFVCLSVAIHEHGCPPFFGIFKIALLYSLLFILEYQVKHKIFQPSTSEKVWILYYWMIFQFPSLYSTNSNCVIPALPLSDCLWISRQPWLSYCPHDWYGIKPGSQYTSQIYRDAVCKYEIEQSMNRSGGRCNDNARSVRACGPEWKSSCCMAVMVQKKWVPGNSSQSSGDISSATGITVGSVQLMEVFLQW